jgi:hypothetical protein
MLIHNWLERATSPFIPVFTIPYSFVWGGLLKPPHIYPPFFSYYELSQAQAAIIIVICKIEVKGGFFFFSFMSPFTPPFQKPDQFPCTSNIYI